jgi:PAS domain S-box-containing protein
VTNELSIIFEQTSDGVFCLDHAGVIKSMNPAAAQLLRLREEVTGQQFWDAFPNAKNAAAETSLNDALSGRRPLRFDLFFPLRYIWVSMLAVPSNSGAVLFMRDISDRVRMMQTEAVQEGVRAIIDVAPVAISLTRGPEHRTELMNARSRELVGNRDVVGRPVRTAFPELEGQGLFEVLDDVYKSGIPYSGSAVPIRYFPDQSSEPRDAFFDVSYQPLRDTAGSVSGILSVSVEVTKQVEARRRLEELIKAGQEEQDEK